MPKLRHDHINRLPQPFTVRMIGDKEFTWPLYDIDSDTGMLRVDVCGKLQVMHIGDIAEFKDDAGTIHDADDWFLETGGEDAG